MQDVRINDNIVSDAEAEKILAILTERGIKYEGRPIRHYTIGYAEDREAMRNGEKLTGATMER